MIGIFSADPQVIQAGIPFFRSCSLDYLAVALLFSLNGYLNGCEKTLFTMTNCCAGALLIRIPLLHFLTGQGIRQLQAYGLVSPCSSLVMIGVILLYLTWLGRKRKTPFSLLRSASYSKGQRTMILWGVVWGGILKVVLV